MDSRKSFISARGRVSVAVFCWSAIWCSCLCCSVRCSCDPTIMQINYLLEVHSS